MKLVVKCKFLKNTVSRSFFILNLFKGFRGGRGGGPGGPPGGDRGGRGRGRGGGQRGRGGRSGPYWANTSL